MRLTAENLQEHHLKAAFSGLKPETEPLWGLMKAQHMVEHISDVAIISNGKRQVEVFTPAEKLEIYREKFLFSSRAWHQNTQSPLLETGKLKDLRCVDLEAALQELYAEFADFHRFFNQNPDLKVNNAVFGPLNYSEWLVFHAKHLNHHLEQFGL
jgi:oxepin-CoA hydrolase/3-oxo-5,6-dehydrosuberyl-CoA semialdehyde dehydrogenase